MHSPMISQTWYPKLQVCSRVTGSIVASMSRMFLYLPWVECFWFVSLITEKRHHKQTQTSTRTTRRDDSRRQSQQTIFHSNNDDIKGVSSVYSVYSHTKNVVLNSCLRRRSLETFFGEKASYFSLVSLYMLFGNKQSFLNNKGSVCKECNIPRLELDYRSRFNVKRSSSYIHRIYMYTHHHKRSAQIFVNLRCWFTKKSLWCLDRKICIS